MTQNSCYFMDFQPDFVCFSLILCFFFFHDFFITFRIFPEKLIAPLALSHHVSVLEDFVSVSI